MNSAAIPQDTRETILAAARSTAQAHGYNGLCFRELAKQVGVKSASIHYHFPTKGDLGAALARMYTALASADLERIAAGTSEPAACLRQYTALFRKALENGNRMCLCGIMGAEYDDLPQAVQVEVGTFADVNVAWLTKVLQRVRHSKRRSREDWALAIFAAVGGAQLAARSRGDVATFDRIIESYRSSGLLPN